MGCLVVLVLLVLFFGGALWLTVGLLGLIFTLFIAGLIGAVADAVIPGRLPGGWLGAVLAGIAGGFIGGLLFRMMGVSLGPELFGVHLIPAFVGALVICVLAELLSRDSRAARYM